MTGNTFDLEKYGGISEIPPYWKIFEISEKRKIYPGHNNLE